MLSRIIKRAAGLSALLLFLSTFVSAQTAQVEGTVKIKGEDGVEKPLPGALVEIYRTDIKGRWENTTDKNGRYIRLGLPIVGTFTFIVSGPGMQPTFAANVRLTERPVVNLVSGPGDGSRLTLEQVQAAVAGGGRPGASGGGQPSSADKAKVEASKKEYEAKVKESQEIQSSFDQLRTRYNQGVELMKANNYEAALSEFEAAAAADPTKHSAFTELAYRANANLAEIHYQLGVALFNERKREEAKPHFEKAVAAIQRSISIAGGDAAAPTGAPAPAAGATSSNDVIVYYNILAKNAMLLVEHYGDAKLVEPTAKALEKAESLDAANKSKWSIYKADLYRYSGRTDEAVAAYKSILGADPTNVDALYGLGLTLIASTETKVIQEGTNALADFVAKAPATDKRLPAVKEALEAVKNAYKIEAEKPSRRRAKP